MTGEPKHASGRSGKGRLLSERSRLLFAIAVFLKRTARRITWLLDGRKYARERDAAELPELVFEHRSQLIRKLGDTDITYQLNKVRNLRLACERISGILIHPGEVFSFCRTVGRPTRRKGYLTGLELSRGLAVTGIGGGLCALSNLMHWMTLHSDLEVTERHRHGFDPFPDTNRVLPFACGATIFYNYKDLQITNGTGRTYQFNVRVGEDYLLGDLRTDVPPTRTYRVVERNHRFELRDGSYHRCNELWRQAFDSSGLNLLSESLVLSNDALVLYEPEDGDDLIVQGGDCGSE